MKGIIWRLGGTMVSGEKNRKRRSESSGPRRTTFFRCAKALARCQRESRLTSSRLRAWNTYCARPGPFRVDAKDGPRGSPIGCGLRWVISTGRGGPAEWKESDHALEIRTRIGRPLSSGECGIQSDLG